MTDELRAKFEAWFSEGSGEHLDWMDHAEAYNDYTHDAMWQAYQAAYASRDAEVEALKRDAAMLDWSIDHARWVVHEHEAYVAIPVKRDADLSSKGMRRQAIDAAMAKEPGE